jgi:hypothetical protein
MAVHLAMIFRLQLASIYPNIHDSCASQSLAIIFVSCQVLFSWTFGFQIQIHKDRKSAHRYLLLQKCRQIFRFSIWNEHFVFLELYRNLFKQFFVKKRQNKIVHRTVHLFLSPDLQINKLCHRNKHQLLNYAVQIRLH